MNETGPMCSSLFSFHIARGQVFTNQCKSRVASDVGVKWAKWEVEWGNGVGVKVKLHEWHSLWVNTLTFVLH